MSELNQKAFDSNFENKENQMVKGKRTGKLEVTSKPKVVKLVPGGEGSHQSKATNKPKEVGLKEIKKDMLKLIDSVDALEQKIVNVSHRVKKLEARVGIPI